MLSGPQRKFCEGIVSGLNQTEAYRRAYPNCSLKACESKGARLVRVGKVAAEIESMRKRADEMKGGAVLTLAEKRAFLARLLRTPVGEVDHNSDLCQERVYIVGKDEDSVKVKMPSKLDAIKIDNDLSGDGAEAEANKTLGGMAALIARLRK